MLTIYIYIYILQLINSENDDLQEKLENFVAIQVAREKSEKYLKEKEEKTSKSEED